MTSHARTLMDKLVSFPTVSRDSNLELIDFVEGYLDGYGVKSTRVPNEDGTKAAIYAHIGPQVEGGVVLSGHTDVPTNLYVYTEDGNVVKEMQVEIPVFEESTIIEVFLDKP